MHTRDDRLVGLFGRRVALRHRFAPDDGPGPHLTDAVGELGDGGADADGLPTVQVRTRRGDVRIRERDVVAVREVPPAPQRRPSWSAVARLERICSLAWPAPVVRELGEWQLRGGADGFTRRAHSALAVGDPGVPVARALAEVERFAAEQGIPSIVASPQGSPWWRAVRAEGWETMPDDGAVSIVLVGAGESLAAQQAGDDVRFASGPGPDWSAVYGDRDDDRQAAGRRAVLRPVGRAGSTVGFGVARDRNGAVTGAVRAAVVEDHLYVSRLQVAPAARRGGVGTALTAAAARWGAEHGARHVVLQVIATNTAARALYERMGCTEHHRYHYLAPGSSRP